MFCLYESTSFDPYENLAIEEYLMNTLPKGTCCLMLWQNDPSVIVGKNQIAAEEINESFVRKKGILTARRNSGGGAVYQDKGNLNYSVIEDMASQECGSSKTGGREPDLRILQNSFYRYMRPVLYAMKQFGVPAEITGRNDIAVGGRKVSGSAQFCCSGKVLHHGCILITTDLDALCSSLRVNSSKYQTRRIPSVRSRVSALCECADRPISTEEFKEQLIFSFRQAFSEDTYMPAVTEKGSMQRILLTDADRRKVLELRDQKYASPGWIYRQNPRCAVHRQIRTDAGVLTVDMDIKEQRIERIVLTGDFFGSEDVGILERRMIGCRLDESLLGLLSGLNVSHYIKGMPAETLFSILTRSSE